MSSAKYALHQPFLKADNGFIPTLNHMGYMTSTLDPYSQSFLHYASTQPLKCLEIGAAYGVATLQALMNGTHIVANDLCADHLQLLKDQVPFEYSNNLEIRPGRFPDIFMHEQERYSSILAARVLHFFNGKEVEAALQQIFHLLVPGGKFFMVCETPFLRNLLSFQKTYHNRKSKGDKWPGLIDNFASVASSYTQTLPSLLNFFDTDVLYRSLKDAGFIIESCEYINRHDFPENLRLDGRESVGAIAVKPRIT